MNMDPIRLFFAVVFAFICATRPSSANKIFLDVQKVCQVNENYLSVAIDTKFFLQNDLRKLLNSLHFMNMLKGLQPAYLRVGGTAADILLFDESMRGLDNRNDLLQLAAMDDLGWDDTETCSKQSWPVMWMSRDRWLALNTIARETNLNLLFDLNVLVRTPSGKWDPTNALKLLKFSQEHNCTLDWQLGNEPNSFRHVFGEEIPPMQLGKDFHTLARILKKFPLYRKSKLVGPDTTCSRGQKKSPIRYLNKFLSQAKQTISAMTWHQYYINGRNATIDEFIDPFILDVLKREIMDVKEVAARHFNENFPIWITETSSAYGGGAPNLSNRFVSGFMWLDKLGMAASNNISVIVRQSFIGGNYGLIDEVSLEPNADFWLSYLYKTVVGKIVLKVQTFDSNPLIRLYAHCSRKSMAERNSVVVYGMNLGLKNYETQFTMKNMNYSAEFEQYILTGVNGQLDSRGIQLNEEVLKMTAQHELPLLVPVTSTDDILVFPPRSIAFYVISGVDAPVCA